MSIPEKKSSKFFWLLLIPIITAIVGAVVGEHYKMWVFSPPTPAQSTASAAIAPSPETKRVAISEERQRGPEISFQTDYIGASTRFDTKTGTSSFPRIWHLRKGESGSPELIDVYLLRNRFWELSLVGRFESANKFVGQARQIGGSMSYTPDDVVLTFASDRQSVAINWSDAQRGKHGYATLRFCADVSSVELILKCAGPPFDRLGEIQRSLKGKVYAGDPILAELPKGRNGDPDFPGCDNFYKRNEGTDGSNTYTFDYLMCR